MLYVLFVLTVLCKIKCIKMTDHNVSITYVFHSLRNEQQFHSVYPLKIRRDAQPCAKQITIDSSGTRRSLIETECLIEELDILVM